MFMIKYRLPWFIERESLSLYTREVRTLQYCANPPFAEIPMVYFMPPSKQKFGLPLRHSSQTPQHLINSVSVIHR